MRRLLLFPAIFLCGCAFHDDAKPPADAQNERHDWNRLAIQMAGEEGGYGAYKMGIKNYPHRVSEAIEGGSANPRLILPILVASNHTDAAAAEMQSQILGTVLMCVGDGSFARALRAVDARSRKRSVVLLLHVLREGRDPNFLVLAPQKYPLTRRIIEKYRD